MPAVRKTVHSKNALAAAFIQITFQRKKFHFHDFSCKEQLPANPLFKGLPY